MPIREMRCGGCGTKFEALVFSAEEETALMCPECGSSSLTRCMSVFVGRVATSGGDGAAAKPLAGAGGCGPCAGGSCSTCH
jgi:putative FmdB family regulatory protein